jgi:hypothetical protein
MVHKLLVLQFPRIMGVYSMEYTRWVTGSAMFRRRQGAKETRNCCHPSLVEYEQDIKLTGLPPSYSSGEQSIC